METKSARQERLFSSNFGSTLISSKYPKICNISSSSQYHGCWWGVIERLNGWACPSFSPIFAKTDYENCQKMIWINVEQKELHDEIKKGPSKLVPNRFQLCKLNIWMEKSILSATHKFQKSIQLCFNSQSSLFLSKIGKIWRVETSCFYLNFGSTSAFV